MSEKKVLAINPELFTFNNNISYPFQSIAITLSKCLFTKVSKFRKKKPKPNPNPCIKTNVRTGLLFSFKRLSSLARLNSMKLSDEL